METNIPDDWLDKRKTAKFISEYEKARAHNKRAIETAIKSHKKLQQLHNK